MNLIRRESRYSLRRVTSQYRPCRISDIPIVVIGASAGGLDAVRAVLVKPLPDSGMGCGGLGLVSMRERADLANDELSIDANPGRGSRIKLGLHLLGSA